MLMQIGEAVKNLGFRLACPTLCELYAAYGGASKSFCLMVRLATLHLTSPNLTPAQELLLRAQLAPPHPTPTPPTPSEPFPAHLGQHSLALLRLTRACLGFALREGELQRVHQFQASAARGQARTSCSHSRTLTTGKTDSTHPWRECPSPSRPSGEWLPWAEGFQAVPSN